MSEYTTGEIAKLCGVSVRTVQYYDTRGILIPSDLTEGGRRLYSEEDAKKLRVICFLREMDFSIDQIGRLFQEEHSDKVIALLIEQQEMQLGKELAEKQEKLNRLMRLKRELRSVERVSVGALGDIARMMENKKKMKRVRIIMLAVGLLMDCIEVCTAVLWARTGIWWPFAVGMAVVVAGAVYICLYYYRSVSYICPECHAVFHTGFKEQFWAMHTPNTRKLTCPHCGKKSYCVEVSRDEETK